MGGHSCLLWTDHEVLFCILGLLQTEGTNDRGGTWLQAHTEALAGGGVSTHSGSSDLFPGHQCGKLGSF